MRGREKKQFNDVINDIELLFEFIVKIIGAKKHIFHFLYFISFFPHLIIAIYDFLKLRARWNHFPL